MLRLCRVLFPTIPSTQKPSVREEIELVLIDRQSTMYGVAHCAGGGDLTVLDVFHCRGIKQYPLRPNEVVDDLGHGRHVLFTAAR